MYPHKKLLLLLLICRLRTIEVYVFKNDKEELVLYHHTISPIQSYKFRYIKHIHNFIYFIIIIKMVIKKNIINSLKIIYSLWNILGWFYSIYITIENDKLYVILLKKKCMEKWMEKNVKKAGS